MCRFAIASVFVSACVCVCACERRLTTGNKCISLSRHECFMYSHQQFWLSRLCSAPSVTPHLPPNLLITLQQRPFCNASLFEI